MIRAWRGYDGDGSGRLDKKSFIKGLQRAGLSWLSVHCRRGLWRVVKKDADGMGDYAGFVISHQDPLDTMAVRQEEAGEDADDEVDAHVLRPGEADLIADDSVLSDGDDMTEVTVESDAGTVGPGSSRRAPAHKRKPTARNLEPRTQRRLHALGIDVSLIVHSGERGGAGAVAPAEPERGVDKAPRKLWVDASELRHRMLSLIHEAETRHAAVRAVQDAAVVSSDAIQELQDQVALCAAERGIVLPSADSAFEVRHTHEIMQEYSRIRQRRRRLKARRDKLNAKLLKLVASQDEAEQMRRVSARSERASVAARAAEAQWAGRIASDAKKQSRMLKRRLREMKDERAAIRQLSDKLKSIRRGASITAP